MGAQASTLTKVFASVAAAAALLSMTGCSSLPVTSGANSPLTGDEQQNSQFCMDFQTAQTKAATIPVGTPKAEVYTAFGLKDDTTLRRLNKEEINRALYGQTQLNIPFDKRDDAQKELNQLEGRALTCQSVHSSRRFGLTHTQVEKTGYNYTLTFIFKDAKLFDPVAISGEPVQQKNNRGYLSDFNPLETATRAARGGF
ncbi:MAG: hypothetical protein ACAH83_04060 [Alphaproteobacteria bacterium]